MHITPPSNIVAIHDAVAKPAQAPAAVTRIPASAEGAKASRAAQDLANLELAREALRRAQPNYDPGHVAQIKVALKSGAIPFDAQRLAAAMLAAHGANG